MKYISLGDVNKKLLFILAGGISKLVAELILYFFAKDVKMNNHLFILGINAGLGMSLAFIPNIILKYRMKASNDKAEKLIFQNSTFNSINSFNENRRQKLSKTKLKILIIGLCCILDYIQKILTFAYSQYILNNLWIFDIVFLGLFSYLILGTKLYSHQYFSCLLMIIFGIVLNAIDVEYNIELIYELLLSFFIEISYNLAVVLAKYGMDTLFLTPFEMTFYEEIFAVILNIIFLSIATNVESVDPPLVIKIAKSCTYEGKNYVDNFYAYWESFRGTEILVFIVQMFSRALFNLFGHIIAKDFTPSHVIFLLMIGELFLSFKSDFDGKKIGSLIIILVEVFMLLVFTEIIELNFCNLQYNTMKNIRERVIKNSNENNDKGDLNLMEHDRLSDDSGDIGGIQLKELSEDDNDNTVNSSSRYTNNS